jgi:hypothetical protein
MEYRRRRLGQVGHDVVPGLRQPALVEDVLDRLAHVVSPVVDVGSRSLADAGQRGKR